MQKYCYLCRLPDRIWVLEPHPATLKWILKCFESSNRYTSYTFAKFTGHKIINILTFG